MADRSPNNNAFVLFADNDESLIDAYDYVCQASLAHIKVCVVSVIGKECINSTIKENLINIILDQNHASLMLARLNSKSATTNGDTTTDCDYETQVSGFIGKRTKVVVLYLSSFLDTSRLLSLARNKKRWFDDKNLFQSWPNLNQNLVKTLLIIYSMSHIVIIYHPEPNFNCQLIESFRILEDLRQRSQPRICESLATLAESQKFPFQWVRNGRLCCPRVLFICDASHHPAFSEANITKQSINNLERQMEDHIYRVLKKTSVIGKPSSEHTDALLHLPPKDDFVFIITKYDVSTSMTNFKNKNASHFYDQLLDVLKQQAGASNQISSTLGESVYTPLDDCDDEKLFADEPFKKRLKQFIKSHIDQASKINQTQYRPRWTGQRGIAGPSPNSRTNEAFVLPRLDDFFKALREVKNIMFETQESESITDTTTTGRNPWLGADERRFVDIYDHYDVDRRFSRAHCDVMTAAALELYSRGLPRQYNRETHEKKLDQAKQFYTMHAFGEAFELCLATLEERCNQTWAEGHQSRDISVKSVNDLNVSNSTSRTNNRHNNDRRGHRHVSSAPRSRRRGPNARNVNRNKKTHADVSSDS